MAKLNKACDGGWFRPYEYDCDAMCLANRGEGKHFENLLLLFTSVEMPQKAIVHRMVMGTRVTSLCSVTQGGK